MSRSGYPFAPAVAEKLHDHFATHAAAAREATAPVPSAASIETLVDAAFWSSLRREEGYSPRISFAWLGPEHAESAMRFETPLSLRPELLAKVAPAVERPGIHLGVWDGGDGRLRVWGTTRLVPPLCFVLEVAAPGLLVVKHRRGERAGKFVNVAVLEGHVVKFVDEEAVKRPDCPYLLTTLLGLDAPASWADSTNVLIQLAVSMRAHGRGGALVVVPHGTDEWRHSVVSPSPYSVAPPFGELWELLEADEDALARSVDAVAGLTAVDGATILTDRYDLLAFGVKLTRRSGRPPLERVRVVEPVEGAEAADVHPSALGGTRHLSAAQFVDDQRDALALVASQDGRFTVFAWSPCDEVVYAHRLEALLL